MLRFIFSLLVFSLCSSHLLAGGGWPQPKENGYFKLYQWWVVADQHFTDVGLIDPNTTNGIFNTSLYAEYGFTDRFTGVVNFPFFSRAYFNNTISGTTGDLLVPGEAINSIGDTDIGFKYGLTQNKPLALSATLTLGLPLGNNEGGTQGNLQTGDGEFNQMLQIDAGRGFQLGKLPAYANAYVGFNNRSQGYSDELRWGLEAGVNLFNKKLWAIGRIIAIESLLNGDRSVGENSTSIFANNTEFISFTPELAWNFNEKWGVAASVGTAFSGRIIFANPSYSVGVFFNLR
ncbi:MAG TPA: hypothetical protein PKA00_13825 [Saprospiraceae bacterium]|nr:hypothetical protein [Saprospiraceae bacterium]HMQ83990.1 hypothetical protein [Saprospiraceae bacterium]